MRSLFPKTFAGKLLMLAIAPTSAAVALLCGVLVVDRCLSIERIALNNLTTSGDMISIHVAAAMVFDDAKAGTVTLRALIQDPNIASARIYDDRGEIFASYGRPTTPGPLPPSPPPLGHGMRHGRFTLSMPIMHKGKVLGTLAMTDDMIAWYRQLYRDILIVIGVGVVAFGCAVALAVAFRKSLMRPITSLAETAKHVSQTRQYAVRSAKYSDDELGELTDAFNEMLDLVQQRDAALAKRAEELATTNTELEQFAYVASHDLQEPLRTVASHLQVIARDYQGKLDEEADVSINFAVDGSNRMKRLINDLLEFSRVRTRRGELEPTAISEVIEDVLADLQVQIQEAQAVITYDPMPTIEVDRTQFNQLLQNLIGNAIKFRRDVQPHIHIDVARQDDAWRFTVRDNGIGIDPQYAQRVFVIFQRLHKQTEYAGTGIGLAVCKRIVEMHGGKIGIEPTTGAGATFYFTIQSPKETQQHGYLPLHRQTA